MLELLFWILIALCIYVYFGYPLLLLVVSWLRKKEIRKKPFIPFISVIIPAHNEEKFLDAKIQNTLALDYPPEQMEILVVSDGSTDRTEEIAMQYGDRVKLLSLDRCGKLIALNHAVDAAQGSVLVFTDANALVEPLALREITANFSDPQVGCVCGNQKYYKPAEGDSSMRGEGLYWKYDKYLKKLETLSGNAIAADGSIYALRRELYMPINDPAQADDFIISAQAILRGYRLVFEPNAVSYEEAPRSSTEEFRRKVRVTNHCSRAILHLLNTLNPRRSGFYSLQLFSHKILRYMVPFFLISAFAINVFLAFDSAFYQALLALQLLFYGAAIFGSLFCKKKIGQRKIFYVPHYFCLANSAAFLGIISLLKGKRIIAWDTQRQGKELKHET